MNISELFSGNMTVIIVLLLVILFFISQLVINRLLGKKIDAIPQVKASEQFGSRISELEKQLADLSKTNLSLQTTINTLKPQLKTIKKSSLIRYNPFRDSGVGGLQSFSTALVDENGNGVVISNLYSREMTRVTAKEISSWNSVDQELSNEEKEAIEKTKS